MYGADVNAPDYDGTSPLEQAVEHENAAAVSAVLAFAPNLASADRFGRTVLHEAAVTGDLKLVSEPVARGAYVNVRDKSGDYPITCLRELPESKRVNIAEFLVEHHADYENVDAEGRSELFFADAPVARYLLKFGADINHRYRSGNTPLIFSCEQGNDELVQALLNHGADVTCVNSKGQRALRAALARCRLNTIAMLCRRSTRGETPELSGTSAIDDALNNSDPAVFWWLADGAGGRASPKTIRSRARGIALADLRTMSDFNRISGIGPTMRVVVAKLSGAQTTHESTR